MGKFDQVAAEFSQARIDAINSLINKELGIRDLGTLATRSPFDALHVVLDAKREELADDWDDLVDNPANRDAGYYAFNRNEVLSQERALDRELKFVAVGSALLKPVRVSVSKLEPRGSRRVRKVPYVSFEVTQEDKVRPRLPR